MEMMVWNIVLSGIVAGMGFMLKSKFEELDRLGILLNKTREEVLGIILPVQKYVLIWKSY
jgi:hypothetical protein